MTSLLLSNVLSGHGLVKTTSEQTKTRSEHDTCERNSGPEEVEHGPGWMDQGRRSGPGAT